MEITTSHVDGGEVNKDRGSFPNITKVQTKSSISV